MPPISLQIPPENNKSSVKCGVYFERGDFAMIQTVESGDGSMSCSVPPETFIDGPKRSFLYNMIYQQPLRLTFLKLDGSSFGIEVEKTGTVEDLKQAVEATFRHLPKNGPGRVYVFWHLQLQFTHHANNTHHLLRVQSVSEDPDSDEEPNILSHLLRGWFSYRKLSTYTKTEERSNLSRFSYSILGSSKNCHRFSSNKYDSRRETGKGG